MAVAGCINAYDCSGNLIRTLEQLQSSNIGVGVQYTAPNPLDDKKINYIKYTDKCGCSCTITGENEILIYATNGVIKNLTLTNDDVNEAIKIKWNDIFGSNRAKTIVRYKTGSYPVSITDGTLAVEETTKNQYSSTPFSLSGVLDETTYYITAFAVDSNNVVIGTQQTTITTSFGWHPSANTLLYIKNDGNISDYSQYKNNHVMNWTGTQSFATISTGRKVASFNGSNAVYCTRFAEGMGKTAFTMHFRMKNKVNYANTIGGWRDRHNSGVSTTDKWGLGIFADNSTKQYPSWGSTDWQSATIGINTDTSAFYLYTATINGRTVNIYKNGNLVGTRTGSYNIIGGSNTGGKFYYGGHVGYSETSLSSSSGSQIYVGEIVVEDKVETVAEIQYFYNKTKNHYA